MVDEGRDADAVTGRIMRETRLGDETRAAEAAAAAGTEPPPYLNYDATPVDPLAVTQDGSLSAASLAVPPAPPPDADAAFRKARLGVVAALALALFLVWIAQRRARDAGGNGGEE